jgi:hypothetical protein
VVGNRYEVLSRDELASCAGCVLCRLPGGRAVIPGVCRPLTADAGAAVTHTLMLSVVARSTRATAGFRSSTLHPCSSSCSMQQI